MTIDRIKLFRWSIVIDYLESFFELIKIIDELINMALVNNLLYITYVSHSHVPSVLLKTSDAFTTYYKLSCNQNGQQNNTSFIIG